MYIATLVCDGCEQNFTMTGEFEMPPLWLSVQVMYSNSDGIVPDTHGDFFHFCSQKCFVDFAKSKELRERMLLVDQEFDPGGPEEEEHA